MIDIRLEKPADYSAVHRVTIDAFAASEFGHNGEGDLIGNLRNSDSVLSIVAEDDGEIVGHILFTTSSIRNGNKELHGMGLGPLSVAPHRQNAGIGSSLVRFGLQRLADDDCPFAIVLGHPKYYPRFGFEPSAKFGIVHGFAGIPQDVFFIKTLGELALETIRGGAAFYHSEFGPQHIDDTSATRPLN